MNEPCGSQSRFLPARIAEICSEAEELRELCERLEKKCAQINGPEKTALVGAAICGAIEAKPIPCGDREELGKAIENLAHKRRRLADAIARLEDL